MNKIHYNIVIKGRVQGVWFRKCTKDAAELIGVKGFVKNNMDRNVCAEAEGSQEQLTEFVKWLHLGSPMSMVSEVIYKEGEIKNFESFEISY
jgi:acylphosphatase